MKIHRTITSQGGKKNDILWSVILPYWLEARLMYYIATINYSLQVQILVRYRNGGLVQRGNTQMDQACRV